MTLLRQFLWLLFPCISGILSHFFAFLIIFSWNIVILNNIMPQCWTLRICPLLQDLRLLLFVVVSAGLLSHFLELIIHKIWSYVSVHIAWWPTSDWTYFQIFKQMAIPSLSGTLSICWDHAISDKPGSLQFCS